jgi:DNA/RNA endonuclease YhcR with UshA esterase domain
MPDERTAVQVGKAILIPAYGEDTVKKEEPFTASLEGNIWTVKGAVRPYPSGNAEVKLSKVNGAVLFLTHSQ